MNNYLNKTYIILDRELKGYFRTPLASIFLLVFLALSSGMTFFLGRFFERDQADLTAFFSWHPWLFLVLMPAIGMRLWAEERRSGTIELLITLPVTNTQLVVGKFLASWIFTLIALILTMPIWITVNYLGEPDNHVILISYFGSWLMAGAFLALTSCLSALTKNQVIANSNEGTMYFVKDQTEHIILTGSWFNEDPEVNPLHLIKEDGKWKLNNTEDILIGYMNGPKFLNSNKDIVFPDQGLEVGTAPYAGNHIRVASIDDENNITWTQVSEKQTFYHCIAVHDIDNNGLNDIFAVSFDEFFIWKQTDEKVFEQTNVINAGRMSAIGIADLDGDSEPEMILGSYVAAYGYKAEFTIYSDNLEELTTANELTPIFTYLLEDQSMGVESFKFDDFDSNGFNDIIVSTESGSDRKILIFMNDGDYNLSLIHI